MNNVRCVVQADNELGETPLWCPRTDAVWWLDIERPTLQSFEPSTGRRRSFPFSCAFLGSLALRRSGGFLLALDLGLHAFDPATGTLTHLCDVETGPSNNRLNDGRCDARGRFWVGTMDIGLKAPTGALYSVDGGTVTRHEGGVIVSNGIAISPDQRTLYFSDTRRFTIWAFDLDLEAGILSNRRVFADHAATGDRPDGACVDEDGCVWVAMFAGSRIARHRPDGALDRTIPVPVTNPTCVCFGGSDLSTLFITSARKLLSPAQRAAEPLAGALLAIEPGVRGLPEAQFAG